MATLQKAWRDAGRCARTVKSSCVFVEAQECFRKSWSTDSGHLTLLVKRQLALSQRMFILGCSNLSVPSERS